MLSRSFLLLITVFSLLSVFNFLIAKPVFAVSCARDSDCPSQPDQTASCVVNYDVSGNAIPGECTYSPTAPVTAPAPATATAPTATCSLAGAGCNETSDCRASFVPDTGFDADCSRYECLDQTGGKKCVIRTGARPTAVPPGPKGSGTECNPPQEGYLLTAIGCVPTNPSKFILAVSQLLSGAGGGIALLLMISGAFRMMMSGGNPDAVKAGSEQFTSALIGLLFIIFAVLLLKVIGVDILNLPGFLQTP